MYTGFCWGDLREGDHLEKPGVDGRGCGKYEGQERCIGLQGFVGET
jgi:hypothetical protein